MILTFLEKRIWFNIINWRVRYLGNRKNVPREWFEFLFRAHPR